MNAALDRGTLRAHVRVPARLKTSDKCIALPAGNAFTFPSGARVDAGQWMVFDTTRSPNRHDLVLIWRMSSGPFVRECELPPAEGGGERYMGVMDADGENVVMVRMRGTDTVGVMTGTFNPRDEGRHYKNVRRQPAHRAS